MSDSLTLDKYRTGYIAEKHNLPDNAARALQLFELGFTISGAAKRLPVSESTVKDYHSRLQSEIHEDVVMPLAGYGRDGSLDVWGDRPISKMGELSYQDGAQDAKESKVQKTDRREQIDPEFRDREIPLNEGVDLEELPAEILRRIEVKV